MADASGGPPSLLLIAEDAFVRNSGIARYETELITHLAGRTNLHLLVGHPSVVKAPRASLPAPLQRATLHHCTAARTVLSNTGAILRGLFSNPSLFDISPRVFLNVMATRLFSGAYIDREGFDLVHGTASYLPQTRKGAKRVITIHDTTPLTMPERHTRNTRKCFVRPKEIRPTDQVIADTQSGLEEIFAVVDHPRENSHVVHLGIDHEVFFPPASRATGAEAPYLLSVGTIEPRKNLPRALAAFERLAKSHAGLRWKIAGARGWGWAEFSAALARSPVHDRVDLVGALSDRQLADHYRGAAALVFPTMWEGFGFPLLEALACGTPVAASKLPALEEVGGDCFVSLDPTRVDSIAEAIEKAAFDEQGRPARRSAGIERARVFTWPGVAEKTLDVYAKALGRPASDLLTAPAP